MSAAINYVTKHMADISVNSEVLMVSVGIHTYGVRFSSGEVKCVVSVTESEGDNKTSSEFGANIVCCDISESGKWATISSLDKNLILYDLNAWKTVSSRYLARAASRIRFTPSNDYIIVADKSGDVYKYSVNNPDEPGTPLLGHMCIILDILITPDEKFIITCDRDEKIRVSCFPNSYNINSYCVGHTEFVTALSLLPHNKEILISASGDGTLRFWEFKIGKQLLCQECSNVLTTHIVELSKVSDTIEENKNNTAALTAIASTANTSDSSVLCTCIHNFIGCCVYLVSGVKDSLVCNLNQIINLNIVPRALALHDSILWIMSLNKGNVLNVFQWDSQTNLFIKNQNKSENQVIKCINKYLRDDMDTRSLIPMLYKRKLDDGTQEYVMKKNARLAREATVQKQQFHKS